MANADICSILEGLQETAEKKLERMNNLIYDYRLEKLGAEEPRKKKSMTWPKSIRQQELECLDKERWELRKQWWKGSKELTEEINLLQADLETMENEKEDYGEWKTSEFNVRRRRGQECHPRRVRLRKGCTQEESGALQVSKIDLADYLRTIFRQSKTRTEENSSRHAPHSSTRIPVW